ncbi:MAG: AlpA family phage regulatory protein [Rhizobiaceae bacterium]|nr:AlpA family phage regulatory protein [Rhizobiaceae bacterium]
MNSEIHPELLSARVICQQIVPISTMSLWRWVRDGKFPAPVKICNRNYWRRSDIEAWLSERSYACGEAA